MCEVSQLCYTCCQAGWCLQVRQSHTHCLSLLTDVDFSHFGNVLFGMFLFQRVCGCFGRCAFFTYLFVDDVNLRNGCLNAVDMHNLKNCMHAHTCTCTHIHLVEFIL